MAAPSLLRRTGVAEYELEQGYRADMRVPARIFGSEKLVSEMDDQVFEQAANVATLPGIVGASYCMPDAHWGYGFPIGGVAATDAREGVISPGGIGFDINCGVRMVRTGLSWPELKPKLRTLVDRLAERVPAGMGSNGFVRLKNGDFHEMLVEGARWAVKRGMGTQLDLELTESGGCFSGADLDAVSEKAIKRGHHQLGTLGSGNHYLEIQVLEKKGVVDKKLAHAFGLTIPEQVVIMFHCGSRGFGHQVATDYLELFLREMPTRFGLELINRELACAPFDSESGRAYFAAMCCASNMAFANRQVILHRVREVFGEVLRMDQADLDMEMVYDVAHNTAKLEQHVVDGESRELLVHRKGATRAFPPGHPELPERYRETGQPVIVGGSMESASWLLAGLESGARTFYSSAHGAGRTMSRARARKLVKGSRLLQQMSERGIHVRAASLQGLAEEAGIAYKSVDEVAEATEQAGLSKRVARLTPVGSVKG